MLGQWPLVGRREEIELLRHVVEDDSAGGIVIAGAAGVGKTRLALDALELARASGFPTERVHASNAARAVPFGAFASFLPPPEQGSESLLGLLQGFARALGHRAEGKRWVLLVDDAQWLDDPSAALVQQLVTHGPVFVIATLRAGLRPPDAITAIWKEGYAPRIDLQPLSLRDTQALVESVLGGPADGATIRTLWEATEGSPLYLRELILGAVASERLNERHGVWVLDASAGVPSRLAELLEARFTTASNTELRAMQMLAMTGYCSASLLDAIWGPGLALKLEGKGLVEVGRERKRQPVRVIHPLYGELLREQTGSRLATELSEKYVSFVEGCGARRRDDALRLATLSLQTGTAIAANVLLRAAQDAMEAFDHPLAEQLASAALAQGLEEAAPLLCEALFRQRRHVELEDVFPQLERLATTGKTKTLLASLRCDNLAYRLGRTDEAKQVIRRAEEATADEELRAQLAGQRATIALHCEGLPEEALRAVEHLLVDEGAPWLADALLRTAQAETFTGRARRALALLERVEGTSQALHGPNLWWHPATIPLFRVHCLLVLGKLHAAHAEATAGYQGAIDQGDRDFQARFGIALGVVNLLQGKVRTADRFACEAAALDVATTGRQGLARWSLGMAALARGSHGDGEAAGEALRELDSLPVVMRLLDGETIERGRAWAAVARGDLVDAHRTLRDAARDARERGCIPHEAMLLHDMARLGYAAEVRERLNEVVILVDGALVATFSEHAAALCSEDPEALERVALSFERLGASLLAAEAFTVAGGLFGKESLQRRANSCLRRGQELLAECEGASTPATRLLPSTHSLTKREVEVASLAAAGTASKEIAERLFISVRTVNNLLQRTYTKLGVSSRAELRTALQRPPSDR